ncbi:GNAT family N-acetyltransferase [Thermococcus argininiproducens]|uniref:GNAT family N-acetyltransferase n=1 Tax=Thermococcus argininiproducens TaxID=2866384 RepID=A0A9E7M9R6_9EURY|nr:GNAT family protein [Thermococcus argininiproducens]USG99643.1 GNAT family N-acetyltransferase [Thermococcus argininiproducens]
MERPKIMEGEKVSLAVILKEDKDKWFLLANDRDIQIFLNDGARIYPREKFDEIYEMSKKNKQKMVDFAIVSNISGELVGFIGLQGINWVSRHAMVWYAIVKEHWGNGYASEALSLLCKFAFENMNLNKIWTRVYEPNKASQRVLEKNGFKFVGRLRKHVYLPEFGYVDELHYDLLREDNKGGMGFSFSGYWL